MRLISRLICRLIGHKYNLENSLEGLNISCSRCKKKIEQSKPKKANLKQLQKVMQRLTNCIQRIRYA